MYETHFGLSKPPFRITPDPEFFFPGGNRGAVLEALVYAVSRGEGIVKVVGEVGSGKTMLCRMLEREVPVSCDVVYLANPRLRPDEILHAIAFELELGMAADAPRLEVMHALHEFLLKRHADNRRVIMFVEEAQGMPLETLEEIRMLSNLETTDEKLLQIVLFGQPELDDKLNLHEIRQLKERITHSFDLAPFARSEIRDYVNARVRASGYRGNDLFTAAAIKELARYSRGLLRRINVLADKSLLAAFAANASIVQPDHVRLAARDSAFTAMPGETRRWLLPAAVGAAVALVATLAVLALLRSPNGTGEILPASTRAGAPEAGVPVASATLQETPVSAPAGRADGEVARAAGAAPGGGEAAGDGLVQADRERLAGVATEQAVQQPVFIDNRPVAPRISATSGLVTTAHLRPRLRLRPQAVDEPANESAGPGPGTAADGAGNRPETVTEN